MDEKEIIIKVREGDKQAFNELVAGHQRRIFQSVYRFLRDYEDAREVTQDAFIRAYQAIKGFRLRCSFYTWVYRIAINLCYRRLRSKQHKIRLKTKPLEEPLISQEGNSFYSEVVSSQPDSCQILISKEQQELIKQALGKLKYKFYQVVVLHDIDNLSYKEIAQIQRCSLGTVMSRLYRARLKLAQYLRKMGIFSP